MYLFPILLFFVPGISTTALTIERSDIGRPILSTPCNSLGEKSHWQIDDIQSRRRHLQSDEHERDYQSKPAGCAKRTRHAVAVDARTYLTEMRLATCNSDTEGLGGLLQIPHGKESTYMYIASSANIL